MSGSLESLIPSERICLTSPWINFVLPILFNLALSFAAKTASFTVSIPIISFANLERNIEIVPVPQ